MALRELAMRQAAYAIESRLPTDEQEGLTDVGAAANQAQERLLLVITPDPSSAALIRRGRRVADYLRAECLAVYVSRRPECQDLPAEARRSLERHLNFARGLRIETRILEASDVADAIVSFARLNGVTQIFVTRERASRG